MTDTKTINVHVDDGASMSDERAEMLALLREVEWAAAGGGGAEDGFCPVCHHAAPVTDEQFAAVEAGHERYVKALARQGQPNEDAVAARAAAFSTQLRAPKRSDYGHAPNCRLDAMIRRLRG